MADGQHDKSGHVPRGAATAPPDVSSKAAGETRGPHEEYRWYIYCRSCSSCDSVRTYAEAEARRDHHKYVSPTNARCQTPGAVCVDRFVNSYTGREAMSRLEAWQEARKKAGIQK